MSDYDEIRAAVDASMEAPPRFTFASLVLALMEVHGGSAPVWRKRVRELLAGEALVRGVDPAAKRRVRTPRILPGPNTVEQALALAIPAPRARARDQARDRVPGEATPATPIIARPRGPRTEAAEMDAWIDAHWATMSLSDRNYYDHDRLAREQRRGRYSGAVLTDAGRRRSERMPAMQPGNDYRENW